MGTIIKLLDRLMYNTPLKMVELGWDKWLSSASDAIYDASFIMDDRRGVFVCLK